MITRALPAWFVVGLWFLGNVFGGLSSLSETATGGVAFFAHLGGFIAGLLLVRPLLDPDSEPRPTRDERRSPGRGSDRPAFWKQSDRPFWK